MSSNRKRFGAIGESTSLNDRIVQGGSAYALTPLRRRRGGNSSSEVRFLWRCPRTSVPVHTPKNTTPYSNGEILA